MFFFLVGGRLLLRWFRLNNWNNLRFGCTSIYTSVLMSTQCGWNIVFLLLGVCVPKKEKPKKKSVKKKDRKITRDKDTHTHTHTHSNRRDGKSSTEICWYVVLWKTMISNKIFSFFPPVLFFFPPYSHIFCSWFFSFSSSSFFSLFFSWTSDTNDKKTNN